MISIKKYFIILTLLLLCGCTNKELTKTIMKTNDSYIVSINYPITSIKRVDNKIKKYIDNLYNSFIEKHTDSKQELAELNIDYTSDLIKERFLKIVINSYQYSNKNIFSNSLIINYDCLTKKFINDIPIHEISINENIKLNIQKKIINPKKKIIALTFDDGPSYYTKSILETLNKYNIKATFFVIGNKVKTYKDILKKVIESGNEIGNHTYNHKLLSRLKDDEFKEQINKTQELIKEYTGYSPTIFRPSYGTINKRLKKMINLEIVLWNIDTLDWKYKSYKTIAKRAISKARDGGIILMHDTHKRSNDALKIIIEELLKQGFEFVTISELNEVKMLRNIR